MIAKGHTNVQVEGTGSAVILIHGVGLDLTMWDPIVGRLDQQHTIIRYDIWGHGGSDDPPGERSVEDFVAQLLGVLDQHGLARADVVGLSIGGLIARGTAARHPDRIDRLALLNTVYRRTDQQRQASRQRLDIARTKGMATIADMAIDRWFTAPWRSEHPDEVAAIRHRLASTPLGGYLKAYSLFVDGDPLMPTGIARVTAPTLVMTGELDVGSTPAMSMAMAADIADAMLHLAPGLHHLPPVEDPEACASPLLDHFTQETTR